MNSEEIKDELTDKYYAEDAMCKSDLYDMLNEFEKAVAPINKLESCKKIKELTEVQGSKGTWDMDEYMCGIFNGMELWLSILEKRDPRYRDLLTKADES